MTTHLDIPASKVLDRVPQRPNITISPSDMTFGWDECPRCVYNKVNRRLKRPAMPMPSIFNAIDGAMKQCFLGQPIPAFLPELPPGLFYAADGWVESSPLILPGHIATLTLRGRYDTVLAFDDGTYGVCDFKTITPKSEHVSFYGRQLHAYAYALENPAPGKAMFAPVSRLGLLAWDPQRYVQRDHPNGTLNGYFGGQLHWVPVPRDDGRFLTFMDEMLTLLERPDPPAASPVCPYCNFINTGQRFGW